MKLAAIVALVLIVCVQVSPAAAQASWSGTVTLNFDSVAGAGCVDATAYLRSFGVTVTQQSSGTVVSSGAAGQCFHGDVVVPSAPKALYVLNNKPVRFSLNFDRAIGSVRFVRARLNAGPGGVNTVGWTATAYNATGAALDEVREAAGAAYSPNFIAAATYSLSGNGIRSVTFVRTDPSGDNTSFGVSFPVLDDFVLTEGAAPVVAATPIVAPLVAAGWPVVEGPGRIFSFEMPAAPAYEPDPQGLSTYQLVFGNAEYSVVTMTLPADATNQRANLEDVLTFYAPLLRSGGWMTTAWTTLQGVQAVEATGIEKDDGLEIRALAGQKGRQLFCLFYQGPVGTMRAGNAERFFNSLTIRP